ncbi:MAG: sugar transferase [Myxococcota bacterium]
MAAVLRRQVKRCIDVGLSAPAVVVLAPVMAGTALLVRTTMGAPVLFTQPRVGENERVFRIFKFRTMRDARFPDEPDEDRIGRVGRFLRSASLDELPQLLNVVLGDMSLVGPRPLLVRYLPRYSAHQRRRHSVLPGLTGLAQVSGRNALSWDEKFAYDVEYVESASSMEDVRILFASVLAPFRRSDVSADGHATMPEFLGSEST